LHLLLIRHGESFVNLDDWEGGFVDAGLTPLGQRQAEHVARWMAANLHLDALYSSTMARTLETAAPIAQETGLTAVADDRLREFGNCYADGRPVPPEAMPIIYPEGWWGTEFPYTCMEGGFESWMQFRVRVSAFLDELVQQYGAKDDPEPVIAVVCHGGVIDAVFEFVFNVGPRRMAEVWTHNTGIVHWQYLPQSSREKWRLHAHGLVHHLTNGDHEWLGSKPMLRSAARQIEEP